MWWRPLGVLTSCWEKSIGRLDPRSDPPRPPRSEEHTSELQSRLHLVCRLLLEKKKKTNVMIHKYFLNFFSPTRLCPSTRKGIDESSPAPLGRVLEEFGRVSRFAWLPVFPW